MIPVNELRIGNWIKARKVNSNKPFATCQVYAELFCDIEELWAEVEPIELTPDILKKIFEENKEIKAPLTLGYSYNQLVYGFPYYSKLQPLPKYLHQFQNLIFALTGTELIINL